MITEKSRKRYLMFGWVFVTIGMVLVIDGLLQIMAGNTGRTGEATIGGVLMILSGLFFTASRRKTEPAVSADAGKQG